ncbi:hypothetical protein RchiOBHm_Chr3g0494261 [Rosa chinensis]|uniref:Uncharacterized protein n=1 Tax=Rosa chinensis TaxID=74649 RepID=A0A2P6RGY2_ROSCH|nr:hypothetical protein RchiOBHm_Chr3g0494261 [Rosa chinensis]
MSDIHVSLMVRQMRFILIPHESFTVAHMAYAYTLLSMTFQIQLLALHFENLVLSLLN